MRKGTLDSGIYYEFEPCDGKPVLMLSNSLGTALAMWNPQMAALRTQYSVLRYDARGHGRSAVLPGPYTLAQMGEDAVGVLDTLGIECAHFCGLSMGGMVGLWLGAHAAGRIGKLILACTAARIGTAAGWNERISTVARGGMEAIVPAVLSRWFTPEFLARQPAAAERIGAMLRTTSTAGYQSSCAAVRDMDQRSGLDRIAARTLVLFGVEDEVTPPASAQELVEGIASASALPLPAAHLANVEAEREFTRAMLDFLGE